MIWWRSTTHQDRILQIHFCNVEISKTIQKPATEWFLEECSGNEIRSLNSRINILFKICVLYDKNQVKKNRETVGVSWAPWSMNCPVWNRFFVEISVFTEWTSLSSIQSDSKSLPIFFYLVFYVIWVRFQRIWDRDDQSLYLAATTLPANIAGFGNVFESCMLQKWIWRIRLWQLTDRHQMIQEAQIDHVRSYRNDSGDSTIV